MKNVSIIICVYNEEKTIENVVKKCRQFNRKSEILVIDDGSDDETNNKLNKLSNRISFKNIRLDKNLGKSNAMAIGAEMAQNEVLLFFDADIAGIQKEHFKLLLKPLTGKEKQADMVLGSPSETFIDYRLNPFKSLTGERTLFKSDILPILDNIRDIRFGVETYLNLYYQAHGKKIKYTLLKGLSHPTKFQKTTPMQATGEFISEGKEIAATLLHNYDLILKRISLSFDEQSEKIKESYRKLQFEINEKLQVLLKNNG